MGGIACIILFDIIFFGGIRSRYIYSMEVNKQNRDWKMEDGIKSQYQPNIYEELFTDPETKEAIQALIVVVAKVYERQHREAMKQIIDRNPEAVKDLTKGGVVSGAMISPIPPYMRQVIESLSFGDPLRTIVEQRRGTPKERGRSKVEKGKGLQP